MSRFRIMALGACGLSFAVSATAQETITYTYDALGRLTSASAAGSVNSGKNRSLCYDAAGNRKALATVASGTANCASVAAPAQAPYPAIFGVSDASSWESSPMTFTVTRYDNLTGTASVAYSTAVGTAGSGDFTAASGTLSFASGVATKTVVISTINDALIEPIETFTLNLSSPSAGALIGNAQGIGTIEDNDPEDPKDPPGGGCDLVQEIDPDQPQQNIQMLPPC